MESAHQEYIKHKDKYLARAKAWRLAHPDQRKEIANRWSRKNPDKKYAWHTNYRKNNPQKYLFHLARRRALKRNIEFNIEISDIIIPDKCPLLGIPIDSYNEWQGSHPSIDRINSSKGYIKGNVMVISHRANILKNNATATELLTLALALGHITGELH